MKKLFALLAAAAMVLSASSTAVQPAFAESPDPMEPSSFIENIGEITPVGEPQPIGETSLHALSADEEFTLEIVDSFPLTEEMIAEAESQFPPAETNEISPMANQPDLYPTSFSADTENYHEPFAADRPVIFTFYIYNTGDAPASNVVVEYDVDGVIESGRRATLNTTIQAGYALKVESQVICPNAGNYQIHLTINPDHTISEERYDNNSVTSALYTWAEFANTYDFKAVSLDAQNYPNDALPVNIPVTYQFTVANVGGKSGSVPVQITANGSTIINGSSGTIPAGYAQNYTFEFSLNYSLTFNMGLIVNPDQSVAEWRTDNNAYTGQFTAIISTDPEDVYGALGFGYPLPMEYTEVYQYFLGYEGHAGLDLKAPEATPIYSVESGVVKRAGKNPNDPRGFYVVIENDSNDPLNGNPIITQYFHMYEQPYVDMGDIVDKGDHIGGVGKLGDFVGTRVDHLHIEFNSQNIINSGAKAYQAIDPVYFWPDVEFTSPYSSNNYIHEEFYNNMPEPHGYFDNKVIDYVGIETYEAWVQAHLNTPEGADVYLFFEDFGITPEVLKEIVHESTYELYIESWPTD